ncbi:MULTISPECIES: hypothetical protein [unclassified Acinetobacter]|jgi:hypothetical protein|uniref:hypothetical protein n=1 Tax=unclassified Acinetobacter TaxID=196816 RepID=UPI000A33633E|nr:MULTISPECIES: hypothetical protein [unclassified Acinetobacter]OTG60430.1 hypothetical protein B9T36_07375 [Acinetobacter sp. ANC 4204]RGD90834.1 hypothetical protein DYI96_08865 [Acinetobacter sp. SWAC57]
MDEKIEQLTNEQLLDVIVLVEENKIIQAIQYIATHTAFQYDDAQEIVTELTKRHDAALKSMYNHEQLYSEDISTAELTINRLTPPKLTLKEDQTLQKSQHKDVNNSDVTRTQGIQALQPKNHKLWMILAVVILVLSFIFYWF